MVTRLTKHDDVIKSLLRGAPRLGCVLHWAPRSEVLHWAPHLLGPVLSVGYRLI